MIIKGATTQEKNSSFHVVDVTEITATSTFMRGKRYHVPCGCAQRPFNLSNKSKK